MAKARRQSNEELEARLVSLEAEKFQAFGRVGTGTKGSNNAFRFGSSMAGYSDRGVSNVVQLTDDATNGTRVIALKRCIVHYHVEVGGTVSARGFLIRLNGNTIMIETAAVTTSADAGSASISLLLEANEYIETASTESGFSNGRIVVLAQALE